MAVNERETGGDGAASETKRGPRETGGEGGTAGSRARASERREDSLWERGARQAQCDDVLVLILLSESHDRTCIALSRASRTNDTSVRSDENTVKPYAVRCARSTQRRRAPGSRAYSIHVVYKRFEPTSHRTLPSTRDRAYPRLWRREKISVSWCSTQRLKSLTLQSVEHPSLRVRERRGFRLDRSSRYISRCISR